MIDLLLLFLGFIASYLFLHLYLKKTTQEKYRFVRFKAKNSILEDEALFFEKTERIAYLKDISNELSEKISAISGKNISDKHLYKDEIIDDYEYALRMAKKKDNEDDETSNDSTDNGDASKNTISSGFPTHLQ
jgi:hypothetical protein